LRSDRSDSALDTLRTAVKDFLIPGSLLFLVLGQAVGVLLLFGRPRAARWGRHWLAGLLFLYLMLSLQATSDFLMRRLTGDYGSLRTADQAQGAQVIVVLSNGVGGGRTADQELTVVNFQSAYNALEAARVYTLLGNAHVLASGGGTNARRRAPESKALASALEALGIPATRIVQESTSLTTHQQAVNVSRWLRERGETRFVLVTAPEHMRRAAGVFLAQGLQPIPSVSDLRYGESPPWQLTRSALRGSESAIYEYVAWWFYRLRGWL
jgi:uncharacterized SAM-binding protein YcdF (DUF218 family)